MTALVFLTSPKMDLDFIYEALSSIVPLFVYNSTFFFVTHLLEDVVASGILTCKVSVCASFEKANRGKLEGK